MANEDTIDFLLGSQRAADTNPVFAVDDDPERAARALDLGATTGVDPSIVYGDLDGFERQVRVALTQDIISGNPHLQSYVAGSPMAAKVSNDDYGNLDAVTQAIEPLSRESSLGAIGKIAKAVKEGFNYEGLNDEYKRLYNYVDNPVWRAFVGNQIFGAAIMTPVLGLAAGTAAFHGAAATAEQGYLALGGSPAWGARFGRDVLAGLQVGLSGQGETVPAIQAEAFNRSIRPYTAAGKEPPAGVSPVIDQMKAKEAEAGAAALEEAVASAQTSLTRERAPDMFADYIRQHTDESIGVPIDAVLELYGGKEPGPNDGLLGFTPRLREQMQLAMETGGDVQIPIADFLAKVDPAVAKALRDHVRFGEGVTVEEGKVFEAWHGSRHTFEAFDASKIGSGEGNQNYGYGTYLAENKDVAETYKKAGDIKAEGNLYQVRVNADNKSFLDLNKPIEGQPQNVIDLLNKYDIKPQPYYLDQIEAGKPASGYEIMKAIENKFFDEELASRGVLDMNVLPEQLPEIRQKVSKRFAAEGIPGTRYLDEYSRRAADELSQYKENITKAQQEIDQGIDVKANTQRLQHAQRKLAEAEKRFQQPTSNYVVFDPSIIQVIDRNGEAVDTVLNAAKLGPLLEEPTAERPFVSPPGWMSKAQYDRYLRLIEKRQSEDLAIAERRAAEAVRQRESADWKAKRLEVQKEVAQDFQQSREFAADDYFRDGLLYGEKIERLKLGEEYLSDEMKEILPKSFVVKDGINPDEVAGFFGYPDGQSMVHALGQLHQERLASGMNAPAFRRAALEAEIDRRMEERYGSFSEKVLEEAKEQALSETQLQLLHEDTLALAEKNGLQYPMTREQFDRTVIGRFSDALVKEVSSDRFLRDAGKAGRAVEDALLKGDFQEAFRQRQRQYVASAMAKEALKFEKASEQVDKLAKRFAPREVSGVEQEYADFVQLLLRQAGFNGKKSLSEIADSIAFHGNESLPEFVQKVKGDGWEPEVAGWLGVTPKAKDSMTVGEFGEFKDALDSLAHIGREVRKIEIKGQKKDWAEWRQGVLDHIQQLPKRTRDSLDKGGRWLYRMDASLTRMEEIIKDLDLREELGPLYQAVIAPMVRSKAKEFDLLTETAKYFKDVRGQFGKEWRRTLSDTIPNDLIIDPHTNTPYDLSRENLIQIMLNWGTRSNIEKFTQGAASVKLGRKATKEEAAALEAGVKAMIDKHATKEDWDFVKAMWEPFRKYQLEADTVSRNVSGVAPKWIPGEAIETPFGKIDGAYWPVKYDRLGSNLAVIEDRSGADALFNTQYFRAATSKNYLKERTGYVDFLDINNSIESAAGVLQQMIHDISFRDALVQANRVFGDKQIRGAIRGHYGVEYEAQLIPWLKRIAHKNSGDQVAVKWWNDWMRRARVNTIGHVLPLNLKVILSPDIGVPNPRSWADYIANRTTYTAIAMEKSNEIRHMVYNMDRDFREQMEAAAKGGSYSAFQRDAVSWGFTPMMKMSQEFRVSTFMEKYNKAKGEGLSDSEAAQIADSYVRERHGAASTVDLPAIMESTESMKILTMFYGYFNTMYNWQRQLPGNVRRREWDKFAVNSLGAVVVPAAFGALLFNQYKENDSWFKIIGKALLLQPLSTVPIMRDFANWWFEGFSPRAPAFGIFQSMASMYTDIMRAAEGKRMKKPVQNAANVIGLSTGLPLAQIGRTGEFAHDVYTGEQRPRNIQEWWRGVVTGESKLKKGK